MRSSAGRGHKAVCGICGTYGFSDGRLLGRMCAKLSHRGPDDEGRYVGDALMLGMRRLKVIDLETGNQPIFNEDGSIAIVYNGELYGFHETRAMLEKNGHVFRTKSDTETIVHMYEEFDDGCVNKLRGMFAFALWDSRKKKLLVARDRIGIKPLYYHHKGGKFLFASEIKSILECSEVTKEVDLRALHDYLTYMYVPAPDTIFRDIKKLPPGHMITIEDGSFEIKRYWQPRVDSGAASKAGEEELTEEAGRLLKESVEISLESDVPLGVFLSGGTDSGSVVALVAEVLGRPVKTFSIGFEEKRYNELDNARLVAKRYSTEHHEFIVKPPSMDEIEEILSFFDEPFADSSAMPAYYVSKCARQSVTVALSGDGGDEVFGGYGNYKADKITSALRALPGVLRDGVIPALAGMLPASNRYSGPEKIRKLVRTSAMPSERAHVSWLGCFNEDEKKALYDSNGGLNRLNADSLDRYLPYFNALAGTDFMNKCMCVDLMTVLPDDYLTKVDRMSMANSLEVRVPFLDHKLVEFALSIPSGYKIKGLKTKHLLKKIMKDRLPREILNGRKKGFSIPLSKWFTEDFSVLLDRYLSREVVRRRGYFNYDHIASISKDHLEGKKDNSKKLWALICLEIWHRLFVD